MAIGNLLLVDVDGPPPAGGSCQVSIDYDTVSLAVTLVRWSNAIVEPATFVITRDSDKRPQTITVGSGSSGQQAPPFPGFPGGSWTPLVQANPGSGPPFIANGWSIAFTPNRAR